MQTYCVVDHYYFSVMASSFSPLSIAFPVHWLLSATILDRRSRGYTPATGFQPTLRELSTTLQMNPTSIWTPQPLPSTIPTNAEPPFLLPPYSPPWTIAFLSFSANGPSRKIYIYTASSAVASTLLCSSCLQWRKDHALFPLWSFPSRIGMTPPVQELVRKACCLFVTLSQDKRILESAMRMSEPNPYGRI